MEDSSLGPWDGRDRRRMSPQVCGDSAFLAWTCVSDTDTPPYSEDAGDSGPADSASLLFPSPAHALELWEPGIAET